MVGLSTQLPSFLLIKNMPNCIEAISGALINKIFVMDEVVVALCLGPMDREEEFINTYICHYILVCIRVKERE